MEIQFEEKKDENIKINNNEELTIDGLLTIESQLKNMEILDKKDPYLNKFENFISREMKQRVKCLGLKKMGKSIMTNTLLMTDKERVKLQEIMYTYNDKRFEDIENEFNEIANEELFEGNLNYDKLPIYNKYN